MSDLPVKRRVIIVGLLFCALLAFGTGIAAFTGVTGNAKQSDLEASTRRNDCRSSYNADFTAVRDMRADAKDDVDSFYDNSQLQYARSGTPPTAADLAQFDLLLQKWDTARQAVRALPRIDDAVANGYTLNGIHHGPCPG